MKVVVVLALIVAVAFLALIIAGMIARRSWSPYWIRGGCTCCSHRYPEDIGKGCRKGGRGATPTYRQRVETMAEENGWSSSETMKRAVDALDRELKGTKS